MTNVEVRVRSSYSALSPTCQKAADYLLAHTRELYSIPIAELARQSGVSSAAWVRLCKEIGYTGLKDMRQQLYLQYSAEPQVEVDPTVHFSDLREGKSAQEILRCCSGRAASRWPKSQRQQPPWRRCPGPRPRWSPLRSRAGPPAAVPSIQGCDFRRRPRSTAPASAGSGAPPPGRCSRR